jgi:hypothetical protein
MNISVEEKLKADGWEISIKNKYGYSIQRRTEPGDFEFNVLDENGNIFRDKAEGRRRHSEIIKEDYRQVKEELIGLITGGCATYTPNELEESLTPLLMRLGIPLYMDGKPRDFCDVFEDIAFMLKGV